LTPAAEALREKKGPGAIPGLLLRSSGLEDAVLDSQGTSIWERSLTIVVKNMQQVEETAMVPSSAERVPTHTAEDVNRRIRQETEYRIAYFADHPDEIAHRLGELDREWDIERAIEANASTLALAGVVFGVTSDRRWLALPALVSGFLLQHAIQGWCPPVPLLRRLGFRTPKEIEQERYALMALRGDFDDLRKGERKLDKVLQAVGLWTLFRKAGPARLGEYRPQEDAGMKQAHRAS
jgi:hypothetical protein